MNTFKNPDEGQLNLQVQQNTKKLNQGHLTLSLIKKGLRTRYISKEEEDIFQLQIMDILKDLILRYTNGESTSVTVDTAENLYNSLIYAIDVGLKSMNDTEAALHVIKNGSIRQAYENGIARITACLKESKALYVKLKKNRLKVGLEAYDLTIDEGLALFFNKYGIIFNAHHTMASIDYPLLFDDMSVKGVFYINEYIKTLYMEDRFCRRFSNDEIKNVLASYGRIYKIDYTKILNNIFEMVVNAAFFSVLSDDNTITLGMTEEKYQVLVKKLNGVSSSGMDELIDEGIKKVLLNLKIRERKLSAYILKYKGILKTSLALALETGSLKNLALLEDNLSLQGQKTVFIDGERMSDESFTILVEKLTEEQVPEVKVSVIKSEVHSLEDFLDILGGNCFFGDEYDILFSQLSDLELALLAENVFSDEMRDGPIDLLRAISFGIITNSEWQEMLVKFLSGLKKERLKSVGTSMNNAESLQ